LDVNAKGYHHMKRMAMGICGVAVLVASLVGAACGSSAPTAASSVPPTTVDAAVFAFAEDLTALTTTGATAQATVIGILSNGTLLDVTSTCTNWASDAPDVLSVTSQGLLTAQSSQGSATISTMCQGAAARGLVTVNPPLSLAPVSPVTAGTGDCPSPPYIFDARPQVERCRGSNGQFAIGACCGR
jgi:hypothetical protein